MHIDNAHIKDWIMTGKAKILPVDISKKLANYLDNLKWNSTGTALEWSCHKATTVKLSGLTSEQLIDWAHKTLLGKDPYVIFFYSDKEPCIACEFCFGIVNIDSAFWKAPGRRYIFGASCTDMICEPIFDHIIEYDGLETLTSVREIADIR